MTRCISADGPPISSSISPCEHDNGFGVNLDFMPSVIQSDLQAGLSGSREKGNEINIRMWKVGNLAPLVAGVKRNPKNGRGEHAGGVWQSVSGSWAQPHG